MFATFRERRTQHVKLVLRLPSNSHTKRRDHFWRERHIVVICRLFEETAPGTCDEEEIEGGGGDIYTTISAVTLTLSAEP
jgi:hypothetical protein